jgi:hypothetical protein
VDNRKTAGRPAKKLVSDDTNFDSSETNRNKGKSAKETAELLGTSTTKVERARSCLADDTPDEIKNDVLSGKKSINQGSKEARKLRQARKNASMKPAEEGLPDVDITRHVDTEPATPESDSENMLQFGRRMKECDPVDAIVSRINSLPDPVKNQVLLKINDILLEAESNMFPIKHSEPSISQLVN